VGLETVTATLPADEISEAGTSAVREVDETKVVVKDVPPKRATEVGTKLDPVRVIVNEAPPARPVAGEIDASDGTGFET